MSPLPLPIRLAAGLAAIAVEQARKLPRDVSEWPMSAVSQALQVSMRVQQRITELAIKGDEALAALREPEEDPPWAVFDEDLPEPAYLRPETPQPETADVDGYDLGDGDTTTAEEQSWFEALDELYREDTADTQDAPDAATPTPDAPVPADVAPPPADTPVPAVLPGYPELSLASLRGRLRVLTVSDLEELLAYERSHGDRPEFVQMLTNRIAAVRDR